MDLAIVERLTMLDVSAAVQNIDQLPALPAADDIAGSAVCLAGHDDGSIARGDIQASARGSIAKRANWQKLLRFNCCLGAQQLRHALIVSLMLQAARLAGRSFAWPERLTALKLQ